MKIFKIVLIGFSIVLLGLMSAFYLFSSPLSDTSIQEKFQKESKLVVVSYKKFKGFEYRVLATQKAIDTTKKSLVFVHGSIGSAMDFKKYLMDTDLNSKYNLFAYDRVGYGVNNAGKVKASIEFERNMLDDFIFQQKISTPILVGYSYGGPIVLTSKTKCYSKVLLAPAIYAEAEEIPSLIKLYEWKLTRWLIPAVWRSASIEKLTHASDLKAFEKLYNLNSSKISSVHGDEDWIVPYQNSLILQKQLPPTQFELVTLDGTGHELVWTKFDKIKEVLIKL